MPPGRTVRHTGAVALINTTTGDLVRKVKLRHRCHELSRFGCYGRRSLISIWRVPLPGAARALSRHVISTLAVARLADWRRETVYELFTQSSAAGRSGCASRSRVGTPQPGWSDEGCQPW